MARPTRAFDRRLTVNVSWNLVGTVLPMLVAVVAIPPLIRGLGAAKFGVLTLAWMVVGYFSLFDLGLGRAMTQLVAERLGRNDRAAIPAMVWTAMTLMTWLGIAGAALVALASPWLVGQVLEIPQELRADTLEAFYWLALSIPIVIGTTGLRGILEAHQQFGLVNAVRIPLGVVNYLAPLAVLAYDSSLTSMVIALVGTRALSWLAYLWICLRSHPDLRGRRAVEGKELRALLSYGGWMTLSNVAAPLLLYLGRLLIAARVSAEAVAWFSTPYDVVINLLIIPSVFVGVLYPAFAQMFQGEAAGVGPLYRRSMWQIGAAMLPAVVITCLVAKPGLEWWINAEFAEKGYRVAQWLAVGMLINSFGHLSQSLVQSYGRPDITAKLHVAELVAYVPYLWWLVDRWGIEGAAVAWVVRVTISTIVLAVLADRCLSGSIARRYQPSP